MVLKCVRCRAVAVSAGVGGWSCESCGAGFPVIGGVPRFVGEEHYSSSFGYQWNRFDRVQLDSANGTTQSRDAFIEKTGWGVEDLRGKRVLDAGCGMGRFAEVCADAGAEVHAVDLSSAVDACQRNVGARDNVAVYQADIMNLPFPEGSFDYVYSLGVLHHTPDTRHAFRQLVPLLKPGGVIAIWVYWSELRRAFGGELLRPALRLLPKRWLFELCRLAVPLYHLHRVPLVGRVTYTWLPTALHPDPTWRWLGTFDWYSPRYHWKHTNDEVEGWFRDESLTNLRTGPFPVSVSGARRVEGTVVSAT